ncbi:TAXI family TRAP transporter solute-binding subunit [Endothiovibrio diazotrophicus]
MNRLLIAALVAFSITVLPIHQADAKKYSSSSRSSSSFSFKSSKSYSRPKWDAAKPSRYSASKTTYSTKSGYGSGKPATSPTATKSTKPATNASTAKTTKIASPTKPSPPAPASKSSYGSKQATAKATETTRSGYAGTKAAPQKPGNSAGSVGAKASSTAKTTRLASGATKHFSNKRQKEAYAKYREKYKTKFKGKADPAAAPPEEAAQSPIYRNASRRVYAGSDDYWDRRTRLYHGWNTPRYVFGGAPSYGIYDGMFLGYMLSHAGNSGYSSFAYHHWDEPGMREWRREMREEAERDAELRTQLDALENRVATMQGTPVDPSYLPRDIQPEMVMSPDVVDSIKPVYRLCTAGHDGNYYRFGEILRRKAQHHLAVDVVETAGSMENLAKMESGECDGAYVQRSAFLAYAGRHPEGHFDFERIGTPAREYAHMICNRKSDVDSVGDLIGKTLLTGAPGSGSELAWSDFVTMDDSYARVRTEPVGGATALDKVALGQADCMLFVASLNTELLKKADAQGERLVLIPVNDWDFNDKKYRSGALFKGYVDQSGEEVYHFADIPGNQYEHIQDGLFSSVETLIVPVDMISSLTWSKKDPQAYESLLSATLASTGEIDRLIKEH